MGVTEVNDRNWHGNIRVSGEWRHIAIWEGVFLRVICTNDLLSIIKRETPHIISPEDGWRTVIFVTNTISKPKGPVDILVLTTTWHHKLFYLWLLKTDCLGFPGGAVVENLPANAGDTGSSPGLGRSHMLRSNWAREPQLLSLRVWSLCPATGGAAIVRGPRTAMKSGPQLPQLEKAIARNEDPTQLKINK